jgi:hypothetical protein
MPGASATPDQAHELRHQIRRLASHPSIVSWFGCNECGGAQDPWTDFVISTVVQEDSSRSIRSASPFSGYSSGVHPLTGIPDGKPLKNMATDAASAVHTLSTPRPRGAREAQARAAVEVNGRVADDPPWPKGADIHGPYQHGGGFPAVNGGGGAFSPPVIVGVQPGVRTGPGNWGFFKSETGCSVMSSFESMSGTLSPENWALQSPPMHERNYPWWAHALSIEVNAPFVFLDTS